MTRNQKYLAGAAVVLLAIAGTAGAATYFGRDTVETKPQTARAVHYQQTASTQQQVQQPPCDDHNIVGTLAGGVAGGVVGAQFGSGSGQTAAATAGALGGAALGNKFIPTRGVTCN